MREKKDESKKCSSEAQILENQSLVTGCYDLSGFENFLLTIFTFVEMMSLRQ
jgi:hypothetical protein